MFGVGFAEIVVILIVALIVLGPEELPKVAGKIARFIAELRHTEAEIKRDLLDIPAEDGGAPPQEQHNG